MTHFESHPAQIPHKSRTNPAQIPHKIGFLRKFLVILGLVKFGNKAQNQHQNLPLGGFFGVPRASWKDWEGCFKGVSGTKRCTEATPKKIPKMQKTGFWKNFFLIPHKSRIFGLFSRRFDSGLGHQITVSHCCITYQNPRFS